MKKRLFWSLITMSLLAGFTKVSAAPMDTEKKVTAQPSGEKIDYFMKGDEYFNYSLTEEHEVITRGEDDFWYYATYNGEKNLVEATKSKVSVDTKPKTILLESELLEKNPTQSVSTYSSSITPSSEIITQKDQPTLAILVEFSDTKLQYSNEEWYNRLFSNTEKSLQDYYNKQTQGRINVLPAETKFDSSNKGIVRVNLADKHPNLWGVKKDNLPKYHELVNKSIESAKEFVDFKKYDNNNDGKIKPNELHIILITAGNDVSNFPEKPAVAAHNHQINDSTIKVNDLTFHSYSLLGEEHTTLEWSEVSPGEWTYVETKYQAPLGTIAHEFGHDLGLPDLYNSGEGNGSPSGKGAGLGYTSLMAWGSKGKIGSEFPGQSPTGLDAYSRSLLGNDVTITDKASIHYLSPFEILKVETNDPSYYYLLENRQFNGYDKSLKETIKNSGIAVYRVNSNWLWNVTNGEQLITVLEADEASIGYSKYEKEEVTNNNLLFYKDDKNNHTSVLTKESTPNLSINEKISADFNISVNSQSAEKMEVHITSSEQAYQGIVGTVPWVYDAETKTLSFGGGNFPSSRGYQNSPIRDINESLQRISTGNEINSIKFTAPVLAHSNSHYLFATLDKLKIIENLNQLNTENVTNMSYMFYGNSSLSDLDIKHFDTSNVTNMSDMFNRTSCLSSLDLSHFDTSKVTNMSSMFMYTNSLSSLDLSHFDTSKVTNMSDMFNSAKSLASLDLSHFDTSKVTNMGSMFSYANSLTILDLSHFDTSKVTNMDYMFQDASSLANLDISHFNTSNVTSMVSMFDRTKSLTSLDLSHFDTSKVTNMSRMFSSANSLASLDLSHFDTRNVMDMSYMFSSANSLTNLNLSNFDTSKVKGMSEMFSRASSLKSLDLSHFDTSNVISMSFMFFGASSLNDLDLSFFNTSKVKDMSYMFEKTSSLTNLDLSHFDTSSVLSMVRMFDGAISLTSLDVSHFDTSQVTDMSSMFSGATSLTSLDVSHFDTSQVTNMSGMFKLASSLNSLDVSHFDTSQVTNMSDMFRGACSLKSLDLSSFNTSKVITMSSMFSGTSSLTSLGISSFDTSQVTIMSDMFKDARSLVSLDLSHFDIRNVRFMISMFSGTSSLMSLDISSFNTYNARWSSNSMTDIFANNNLHTIVLGPYTIFSASSIRSLDTNKGIWNLESDATVEYQRLSNLLSSYNGASPGKYILTE